MGNVTVVNAGKSNAHSPGSIAFVVWIAFSKSVKNHIAHSSESFLSSTTWTECFRAFLNFEITSYSQSERSDQRESPRDDPLATSVNSSCAATLKIAEQTSSTCEAVIVGYNGSVIARLEKEQLFLKSRAANRRKALKSDKQG